MPKALITCTCSGSQAIDAQGLAKASGLTVPTPCSALCTTEIGKASDALKDGDAIICCQQEARVFGALAEALELPTAPTLDLRDRAGWTRDKASTLPKMSALVAEAQLPARPDKMLDVVSEGLCLILGDADVALAAADALHEHLGVTVLLADSSDLPETRSYDVVVGQLRRANGALGRFDVVIDQLQQIVPGGRGAYQLSAPRDGGRSECDIILDLRAGAPLFPAHEKREGYLRADPGRPAAVSAAILAASHLVGTFEKPLYVSSEPLLCAHSRAEQTGCTRCLDLCPTGAITPSGDHVTVDPMICAGCGACSAACPSGAISYDAPPVDLTMRRVQTLAKVYHGAGGTAPRLLVHDDFGTDLIALCARHGGGLPADVIPMHVPAIGAFGHAEMVAALAAGFAKVDMLPGPQADGLALDRQAALACAIGGEARVEILEVSDPERLSDLLFEVKPEAPLATPVRPMGTRRQITRTTARALQPDRETLELPEGAPYGAVLVDTDACTLCLSCVSLCPSGALGDNPDAPQLRFQEDACLQCGICSSACPEDAITYEARLDLTDAALSQRILHEEEPFACIECGALFGVKSTVEKVSAKLSEHSMFSGGDKIKMIQMCDNCRVNAQYHAKDNPFAEGERPRPRTTDDYLSKRRDH